MIWGFRGVLKNNDSGENRNPDWYVIHASVCSVSHGCGSVDVWCGVGNYTALSLDHPISRSDNADYRLIKSCLASRPPTTLHCPAFCIFCCRNRAVAGIRCWWPMQNKATQKVIKRPATAAPEPKMQKQCSANPPTCPLVQFFCTTTTQEKQAARFSRGSQLAVSFNRQSLLFDNLLEREAAKQGRQTFSKVSWKPTKNTIANCNCVDLKFTLLQFVVNLNRRIWSGQNLFDLLSRNSS